MNTRRFSLPAFLLVAAALTGCADDEPASAGASGTATASAADIEFAQRMIPHHEQAVEMAQLMPADGVSPELIQLADAVEAAQQPEIDELSAMLEEWGEDLPSAGGEHAGHGGAGDESGMAGMMSEEDLATLDAAVGADFERSWLTMMIEHHEGAISMAEAELADGSDPEAQELARAVVDAQRAEITRMEQLLDALS